MAPEVAVFSGGCRTCQYLGAGSATVNALFPSAALTVDGVLAEYSAMADSGNAIFGGSVRGAARSVANSSARPQFTGVRVGTFDDSSVVQPVVTIWTVAAPPWR